MDNEKILNTSESVEKNNALVSEEATPSTDTLAENIEKASAEVKEHETVADEVNTPEIKETESSEMAPVQSGTEPPKPKNRRGTKWFITVLVAMMLVFFIPMITVGIIVFALPPVYNETFIGELGEKYDRLNEIDEPKVIIIGGSSVAFGIDSKLMEEKLGMKVVNFGLYANLGTKLMIDLSRSNINEGDIIIIAPEMSEQTLSLYFNAETVMQALDGNIGMLKNIDTKNYEALVGASWKFSYLKLNYLITGERPANSGAYKKENFNEYGDNVYDRPYNEMTQTTNVINLNFRTNYDDDTETKYEEYIDYINDYIKFANRKGATVYYSLCPMNEGALGAKNTADVIYEYYRNLVNSINCKVISNVNDYILDEGYFFDSEFHLNNAGVTVRTVKLIDDIKREQGILTQTMPASDIPAPPGFKPAEVVGGNSDNLYFVLERVVSKTMECKDCGKQFIEGTEVCDECGKPLTPQESYKIIGFNEEGKKQTRIEIPNNIDDLPVRTIGANALLGCSQLKELVLGQNITAIEGMALSGGTALEKLIIPDGKDAIDISVPNKTSESLITDGECNPDIKIYVDKKYYESFAGDYFWGDYGIKLTPKE